MDYPATQMFVSDEENVDEDEDDENSASPLGDEKNVEVCQILFTLKSYFSLFINLKDKNLMFSFSYYFSFIQDRSSYCWFGYLSSA